MKTTGQLDQPQLILIMAEQLHRCYSFNLVTKGDNLRIVLYCDVNMDPARNGEVAERGRRVAGRGRGIHMRGGRRRGKFYFDSRWVAV